MEFITLAKCFSSDRIKAMGYGKVGEWFGHINKDWKNGKRLVPAIEVFIAAGFSVIFIITLIQAVLSVLPTKDKSATMSQEIPTIFAPTNEQTMENSPGGVQVSGDNNAPITTYSTTTSNKPEFHYEVISTVGPSASGIYTSNIELQVLYQPNTRWGNVNFEISDAIIDCLQIEPMSQKLDTTSGGWRFMDFSTWQCTSSIDLSKSDIELFTESKFIEEETTQ